MKYLLVIGFIFLFIAKVSAQEVIYPVKHDSSIIKIKEYYNSCGKIYNIKNNYLFPSDTKEIFIPTGQELLSAEQLMNENYTALIKSDDRVKALIGTDYKQYYYKFYRQYVGIIDSAGNKKIFIQLFKCCKKKIDKCFPNWKNELISPLDEDPCTTSLRFIVNLTQKKISLS